MKASSLILIDTQCNIILQLRDDKEGVFFRGCWGLIGGAVKNNETPNECIIRECWEETHWRPNYLRKLLEINEHCNETVFVSYIESEKLLCCLEGQKLKSFSFQELDSINISPYHKRIISQYHPFWNDPLDLSKIKVLFYTKVLPPAFGGYVSAGINLYNLLSAIANVHLVSDKDINELNSDESYDLLFFNATYENSNLFNVLSERCKQVWTFEHNEIRDDYFEEMSDRFNKVSRILVPSSFLKQRINYHIKTLNEKEPTVLPIPINSDVFFFQPHEMSKTVRFITCCAIKKVRDLEFTLLVMKDLLSMGLLFQWNIYGEVPYLGDYNYYERLCTIVEELGLTKHVIFHKALKKQRDISKALHNSDFYIDFSQKETYGMAKIEAALTGVKLILPSIENNCIFNHNMLFYDGTHKEVASQIYTTIEKCMSDRKNDIASRLSIREDMRQFDHNSVSIKLKKLLYETV